MISKYTPFQNISTFGSSKFLPEYKGLEHLLQILNKNLQYQKKLSLFCVLGAPTPTSQMDEPIPPRPPTTAPTVPKEYCSM